MNCVHGITIDTSTFVYTGQGNNIDTKTADIKLTGVRMVKDICSTERAKE